jgi:hypothetical protein
MRPQSPSPRHRIAKAARATALAVAGSIPAVLIASSARASGITAADEWAMGLLALAFGSMLVVLTLLGSRMTQGLRASLRERDRTGGRM